MSGNSSCARNQIAMKPSQHFGAPTVEYPRGVDVCKYASAKEHVVKNQKTTICHFGFMEKVYGLLCTVRTATAAMLKYHRGNVVNGTP